MFNFFDIFEICKHSQENVVYIYIYIFFFVISSLCLFFCVFFKDFFLDFLYRKKILRFLIQITEVTTEHQKRPERAKTA